MIFEHTTAKLTGYYPFNNRMEGGLVDEQDRPLQTLQGFLGNEHNRLINGSLTAMPGAESYISVAADRAIPFGTLLWFPTLDEYYGARLPFMVVDRGAPSRFDGKGLGRFDICCALERDTLDDFLNRPEGHYGIAYFL